MLSAICNTNAAPPDGAPANMAEKRPPTADDLLAQLEALRAENAALRARIAGFDGENGRLDVANVEAPVPLAPFQLDGAFPPELIVKVGSFLDPMSKDLYKLMKTCTAMYDLLMPRFLEVLDLSRFGPGLAGSDLLLTQFMRDSRGLDKFKYVKKLISARPSLREGIALLYLCRNAVELDVGKFSIQQLLALPQLPKLVSLSGDFSGGRAFRSANDDERAAEVAELRLPRLRNLDVTLPPSGAIMKAFKRSTPSLKKLTLGLFDVNWEEGMDPAVPAIMPAELSKSFLAKVDTYRVIDASPRAKYIIQQLSIPQLKRNVSAFAPSTFSVGNVFRFYHSEMKDFWTVLWDGCENIQLVANEISSKYVVSVPCDGISIAKINRLHLEAWKKDRMGHDNLAELAYTVGFRLDESDFVIDKVAGYNHKDDDDCPEGEEFWPTRGYCAWQMEYELWCKTVGQKLPLA